MLERDDEFPGIGRGETDGGKVGQSAGGEGAGVFDGKKKRGFGRGGGGREDAAVRVDEVAGGDGIAVGPASLGAEVKRVSERVGRDFPAEGDGGLRGAAVGAGGDEALGEGADDEEFVGEGGGGGVEIGGLVALAEPEDLRRGFGGGRGIFSRAGGEEKDAEEC